MHGDCCKQLQLADEILWRYASLLENSTQRSSCQFSMQGNNATRSACGSDSLHNDVTPALSDLREAQSLKYSGSHLPLRFGAA
jgi:hypothetical protein